MSPRTTSIVALGLLVAAASCSSTAPQPPAPVLSETTTSTAPAQHTTPPGLEMPAPAPMAETATPTPLAGAATATAALPPGAVIHRRPTPRVAAPVVDPWPDLAEAYREAHDTAAHMEFARAADQLRTLRDIPALAPERRAMLHAEVQQCDEIAYGLQAITEALVQGRYRLAKQRAERLHARFPAVPLHLWEPTLPGASPPAVPR